MFKVVQVTHVTCGWTQDPGLDKEHGKALIFGSQFWSLGSPGSDGHMWSTSGEGPVPL